MYQALYRKYRPKDFDSVVGQDAIIQTLKNSIIHQNFSHAYLFFGPRGTGKTTVSKIFARNINCMNPIDGIACEKCDNCNVSFSKDCIDIIEIDAASNNGVDEIRELKNKITLVPSKLKYKVYIIDEVHMLSIGAFNALLKTLEEPPEHAVFILATTDPQKVPATIVSRCQCFSFRRISDEVISNRLRFVCEKEKIKIDDDVLASIASLSEGGMRDALGLLDKLVSYTDKKITMEDFVEVNGIISNEQLKEFIVFVMNGKFSDVLKSINEFDNCGKNLIQILIQLLNLSRNLLVDYYLNHMKLSFSVDLLQEFANQLNKNMFDIKKSGNPRIYIEMFLLKFMHDYIVKSQVSKEQFVDNPSNNVKLVRENKSTEVVENNNSISLKKPDIVDKENSVEENSAVADDTEYDFSEEFGDNDEFDNEPIMSDNSHYVDENAVDDEDYELLPRVLNIDEIIKARVNNTLALANKNLLLEETKKFELLNDYTFDQKIGFIACSLLDSKIRAVSPDNVLISYEYDSNVRQDLTILDKIIEVYQTITKSTKNIAIITDEEWEKLRAEYITNLKNGVKYEIVEEPKEVLEEVEKNDIISNSAVELFGDIVEIE